MESENLMKSYGYEPIDKETQNNEENLFGFGVNDGSIGTFAQEPNPGGGGSGGTNTSIACVVKTQLLTGCSACRGGGSGQIQKVYNLRKNLYFTK